MRSWSFDFWPMSPIFQRFKHRVHKSHRANGNQMSYPRYRNKRFSNGPGHLTNMTTMTLFGKSSFKNTSAPEQVDQWLEPLYVAFSSIGYSRSTKLVNMMNLGWAWPSLMAKKIIFKLLHEKMLESRAHENKPLKILGTGTQRLMVLKPCI